jgi:TonB family protein
MTRRAVCAAVASVVMLAIPAIARCAAADIAAAKSLYAAASYEEALKLLDSLQAAAPASDADDFVEVEQYRALCFLALGETDAAQAALGRIVDVRPLYRIEGADVSPKLVDLYDAVRTRELPSAAKSLYARAKDNFDSKQLTLAVGQFKEVAAIVDDAGGNSSTLRDLKELSDGFLQLAESQLAAEAARAAASSRPAAAADPVSRSAAAPDTPDVPASAAPAAPAPAVPAAPKAPAVYTVNDAGVTPPVPVSATPPPWRPRAPAFAARGYRGVLEYTVDEHGHVESAVLRQPVSPDYDQELVQAAKQWTFSPATKDGKPVKFRKQIEIILQPQGQ